MGLQNKIIWTEGMFLQPQHFQQQDHYVESLITKRSHMLSFWSWGITEFKLDENLLTLGKVSIETCRGIFPDGTMFDIPGRDSAPLPLDIPAGTRNCIIYLAIPHFRTGVSEGISSEMNDRSARYSAATIEVDDQNAGGITVPVQIAKLALRLILESEEKKGFSCLGLLRIAESRSDHQVVIDEE